MRTIILKGLPDRMIRRLLPGDTSETEAAYANIGTVLLLPTEEGGTLVVFDVKAEWNFVTDLKAEDFMSYPRSQINFGVHIFDDRFRIAIRARP